MRQEPHAGEFKAEVLLQAMLRPLQGARVQAQAPAGGTMPPVWRKNALASHAHREG